MNIFRHIPSVGMLLTVVCGLLAMAGTSPAQEIATTNSFPTNLFLTDEHGLFWYKGHERLIAVKKIEEAQKSRESRPADEDPEGHWGSVSHGCQISLSFEKLEFTNGEPVIATMLMRNVSDRPITYLRQIILGHPSPIYVSVWQGEKTLRLKTDENISISHSRSNVTLQPRTQHRYRLRLDEFYDLSTNGLYSVQAAYGSSASPADFLVLAPGQQPITSQKVTISITNAPAR